MAMICRSCVFWLEFGVSEDMANSWTEYWRRIHEDATETLPELVPIDDGAATDDATDLVLAPSDVAEGNVSATDGTLCDRKATTPYN